MTVRVWIAAAVASAVLLFGAAASDVHAQAKGDAKSIQRQLDKKKKELRTVAADRRKIDTQRGSAVKQLRAADEQVGVTAAALAKTQQQIAVEKGNLQQLDVQRSDLKSTLGEHVSHREKLVRAAYRQGRAGPLKAMLSQDSVAKSQRHLIYHRYLQKDRRDRIHGLNQKLTGLDQVQREINVRSTALTQNQIRQQQQAKQLERDRAERAKVVSTLNAKYADASAREKALGKDVAGLNKLLAQLRAAAVRAENERRAIARKRAAEAAAAKREEQRLAKAEAQRVAKAEAQRKAQEQRDARANRAATTAAARTAAPAVTSAPTTSSAPATTVASEPDTTPVRKPRVIDRKPATQVASASPSVGGVGWPANGALLAGFGGTMPDGRRSQGLLIGAARGAPVRAVSGGEVVYAQWMTGYGQLLIIDHGGGRMSLYAYNEALLKSVGDRVSRGDTIATVGTSGGQGTPAVYFELRSNGSPVNPRSLMQ